MRPLNRPMFRYGGPIKEGVMSGIREPKKDGGSMSQLVKPNNDGSRPGYAGPATPFVLAGMGLARLAPFLARAARPVANFFRSRAGQVTGGGKGIAGKYQPAPLTTKEKIRGFFETAPAGKFVAGDPVLRTIAGGGKLGSKIVKPTAKFMFGSPTGLAISGYSGKQIYDALKSDPAKDTDGDGISDINKKKAAIGMPENLTLGGGKDIATIEPEGPSASDLAKSRMEANRKKYYEIMGIDKMGRQATGDALINASRAINQLNTQGIGLKEGLKSGQLQNLIIEGISSAMDKPSKTKDAVDAAILKAEIAKDIDAEKGGTYAQNAKDYAKMKYGEVTPETMAQAYKDLGFNKSTTFAEDLISNAKNMGGAITSDVLSTTIQSSLGIVPEVLYDATTMVDIRKSDDFTNDKDFAIAATKNKGAGVYVVDTVAVAVDGDGNQKVLFSG
tara:strand:+ start:267 stop:1601 length:1335 start_codon:yes stop_codon:yes gene_type:complete